MEVIVPADNAQACLALEYALSRHNPVYIRLTRNEAADLPQSRGFASREPIPLREGKDVTLAATGLMAAPALAAADALKARGISAEVFSVPFVKPVAGEALAASVKKTGKLVTVEEHSVVGGFGSACLEHLAPRGIAFKHLALGLQDCFGDTGGYDELLAAYGLDANGIEQAVQKFA
jgi:transketolase